MELKKILPLIEELHGFLDLKYDDLQPFTILLNWGNQERRILGGTINTKIIHSKDHIRLLCELPPKTFFAKHWHDCKEVITVMNGKMTDKLNPKRFWVEGQKYTIEAYQAHAIENTSETETLNVMVDFYK